MKAKKGKPPPENTADPLRSLADPEKVGHKATSLNSALTLKERNKAVGLPMGFFIEKIDPCV